MAGNKCDETSAHAPVEGERLVEFIMTRALSGLGVN